MAILINGEPIELVHGSVQRSATEYSHEVEGAETAEYRLTETDQTDPAGRFRFRVTGDALLIQRARRAEWAEAKSLITVEEEGVTLTFSDDGMVELLKQMTMHVQGSSLAGLYFRQLVESVMVAA